jgi:hypothetical protein
LWIELILRVQAHYRSGDDDPNEFVRSLLLYAVWCARSESPRTREAAFIEFYYWFPKFAMEGPEPVHRRVIADLVSILGMSEIEQMGAALRPPELKKFRTDAQAAADELRRRSQKR